MATRVSSIFCRDGQDTVLLAYGPDVLLWEQLYLSATLNIDNCIPA